jgi:hypothetical protein
MTLKHTSLEDLLHQITARDDDPIRSGLATLVAQHWAVDLTTRNPAPALIEADGLKPTDLDLAAFLAALVDRHAVINIPEYRARRPVEKVATEHVISKENRHGHIVGLRANKEVFSFSILIKDTNVMTMNNDQQEVGAYRTFMIVDLDGTWYDGWKTIEFLPTAKENAWLDDKQLWTDNKLLFQNFVHPLRWPSFYGKYYIATKVLIARLEDEARALRGWIKERRRGAAQEQEPREAKEEIGASKKIVVAAFEAVVDGPDLRGKYNNPEHISDAVTRLAEINKILPSLRFATRATELSFHQHGPDPLPGWIDTIWSQWRGKGCRTVWNRITVPMAKDVAICYRVWDKIETVAE